MNFEERLQALIAECASEFDPELTLAVVDAWILIAHIADVEDPERSSVSWITPYRQPPFHTVGLLSEAQLEWTTGRIGHDGNP